MGAFMRFGFTDDNNEDIIAYYKRENDCHYTVVYLSGFCEEYDSLDQNEEITEKTETRNKLMNQLETSYDWDSV